MIFFQEKPSPTVQKIVSYAIEYLNDMLQAELHDGKREFKRYAEWIFDKEILKMFPPEVLVNTLNELLAANNDKNSLYFINDFHWLLLDRVLKYEIPYLQDKIDEGLITIDDKDLYPFIDFKKMKLRPKCELDYILDVYFWDNDYDLVCFRRSPSPKPEDFGCSPEIVKVTNRIRPTADDLKITYMKPVSPKMTWDWNGVAKKNLR